MDGVPQDNGVPYFPVAYFNSPGGASIQVSNDVGTGLPVRVQEAISGTVTVGNSVTIGSIPAISGTVTANAFGTGGNNVAYSIPVAPDEADAVTRGLSIGFHENLTADEFRTVKASEPFPVQIRKGSVTIGSLPTLTPQLPRVTFIDGSGTVVTANSAVTLFASSSTRSYLLVQVTTGSAFVNVGATATTLNGISLTAGQGYAWETTIPQGAVSLISTTTNSAYVAKQA